MTTADLLAIFSYSPGSSAMIAIVPAGNEYNAVTISRPDFDARPLAALKDMGYQLADPTQRWALARTMAATVYAKLRVVPIP